MVKVILSAIGLAWISLACQAATTPYATYTAGQVITNIRPMAGCVREEDFIHIADLAEKNSSTEDINAFAKAHECFVLPAGKPMTVVAMDADDRLILGLVGKDMTIQFTTMNLHWSHAIPIPGERPSFPAVGDDEQYPAYREKLLSWGATPVVIEHPEPFSVHISMRVFPEVAECSSNPSGGCLAMWKDENGRAFSVTTVGQFVQSVNYDKREKNE